MAKAKTNEKKQTQQNQNRTWVWAAIVIVGLLVMIVWQSQTAKVFSYIDGDDRSVLVLLRGDKDVSYTLQYLGKDPIEISKVQLKLTSGTDLVVHTDVEEMVLISDGQQVVLESVGSVPAGQSFTLNSQDQFQLTIRLYGRSLGHNRLDGLLFTYLRDGEVETFELPLAATLFSVE
jgi:hypothetical protein